MVGETESSSTINAATEITLEDQGQNFGQNFESSQAGGRKLKAPKADDGERNETR